MRTSRHFASPARFRELTLVLLALLGSACLPTAACYGQAAPVDPVQIVRNAAFNEQHAGAASFFRFRYRKTDDGKTTLKEVIETRDGNMSRLLEVDGKPLEGDEKQKEFARLDKLRDNPDDQAKRVKRERADGDRANALTQLLPQAFLYTFAGIVPGPSGPCYRLTFVPNPGFVPPNREAEVYHGMAGELWIDQGQQRLARFQAHLISDVNFGWGVVGRLYKGGTILVQQKDVGAHRWEPVSMDLNLSGKILLVKALEIKTSETFTGYTPVAAMTYQQAIAALEAE